MSLFCPNKQFAIFTCHHSIPFAKQIGKRLTVCKSMLQRNIHDLLVRILQVSDCMLQPNALQIILVIDTRLARKHFRQIGRRIPEDPCQFFKRDILRIVILEIGCDHPQPVQLHIAFDQVILHIQLPVFFHQNM